MPKCSKCKTELHLGEARPGAMPGFGMIMGGGAVEEMVENFRRQPRGCTACNKNFCSACTYRDRRHMCPQCGKDLGDINSRSTFIVGAPEPGCFIATACYGSVVCPEVVHLRRFRDDVLLSSTFGRCLTRLYYRLSPPLAAFLSRHPVLCRCVRGAILNPIVSVIKRRTGKGTGKGADHQI
jgi:hypothetical protein